MKPSSELSRRTAFSLIELLVVIAIVGILASLLLPALGRAKEKAKLVECRQQLRQLGIAAQVYAGDHADRLPRIAPEFETPGAGLPQPTNQIYRVLGPYVDDVAGVFHCPKDPRQKKWPGYSSYEWNSALNGRFLHRIEERQGSPPVLISDRASWHEGNAAGPGQNAVFSDGQVDWVSAP